MMRMTTLAAMLMLVTAPPVFAGENPSAKLAMHVVASDQYLYCPDLTPAACDSINVDVSAAEILATSGYGYVAFVAYDVEGLTGAEFSVSGWPSGRGAPQLSDPYWCPEGTLTMGEHLGSGGIAVFPCVEASAGGLVLVGYCSFGPLDEEDLPITLEYAESDFSYSNDPHNYVLDCTVQFREDAVVAATGCTIGGTHEVQPDCPGEFGDGGPEGGQESAVVESGLLYVYGNRLNPPYVFSLDSTELRVNGVRLYPPLRRATGLVGDTHPVYYTRHALKMESFELAYSMLDAGFTGQAIADSVARLLGQSDIVSSVAVDGALHVSVRWAGDPFAEGISLPSGPPVEVPEPDIAAFSECRAILRDLRRCLEPGAVVLYGNGYQVWISAKHRTSFEEQMRLLQDTGDTSTESHSLIPSVAAQDLLVPVALDLDP